MSAQLRSRLVLAIAACVAFAVSAGAIAWLRRSSDHADRPPLFAIAALFVAIFAGAAGLVFCVRGATLMSRHPTGTD